MKQPRGLLIQGWQYPTILGISAGTHIVSPWMDTHWMTTGVLCSWAAYPVEALADASDATALAAHVQMQKSTPIIIY